MKSVTIPVKAWKSEQGEHYAQVEGTDSFVSSAWKEADLPKRIKEQILHTLELDERKKRNWGGWVVGTASNTVLIVKFDGQCWGYEICGPDRSHSSSCIGAKTKEEAIEQARTHAADYGGIIYEHSLLF